MKRLTLALLATAGILSSCYTPGLNFTADLNKSAQAGQSLGAKVMRVEFDIATPATSMDSTIDLFADRGIRVLPLAGFSGTMPTNAEAQNLAGWAYRFGPNGAFWQNRPDGQLAITAIEFGNETSYQYQYGDPGPTWWTSSQYVNRARAYAQLFKSARVAMDFAGFSNVALLAQADDGGSANPAWVDNLYVGVSNFNSYVDGWTVHPYGPQSRWEPKLDRLISYTAAHGAGSVPIDITEYGIASDNGIALTDNYGFPTNLTYSQAALALSQNVDAIRAKLGDRLRHFMIYQAHDNQPHAVTTNREAYFGGLQSNLAEKGNFSAAVRDKLNDE